MTELSQNALQAERNVFHALPPYEQYDQVHNLIPGATALNNARNAELALRGNLRYIETKEGADLPFRGILQPLGVPEDHVKAMLADTVSYPGLKLYEADPKTGKVEGYQRPNTPSPEIIKKRLTEYSLPKVIKDKNELTRIQKEVEAGGEYPYFYHWSPLAVHMYADFMRKYTNNPNIRVPKNNNESEQFRLALEGDTNGEKLTNAGIPMPGYFNSHDHHVVGEGEWTHWVSSAPFGGGVDTLGLDRDDRNSLSDYTALHGSSPLLFEDHPPA